MIEESSRPQYESVVYVQGDHEGMTCLLCGDLFSGKPFLPTFHSQNILVMRRYYLHRAFCNQMVFPEKAAEVRKGMREYVERVLTGGAA